MTRVLGALSVLIFAVLTQPVARLRAETVDDAGLWFVASGNGDLQLRSQQQTPLLYWFDTQYRMAEDTDGFSQALIRPGVGVPLSEHHALWAGYAWVRTSPVSGDDFDENRLWQQWTHNPQVGDWNLGFRSRFEQRWVETGDDVGLRWRQLFRGQRVLTSSPQWSLVGWDEFFFHLNDTDWGAEAGFDQNRAFFGYGFKRCKDSPLRTEIGYLNQFTNSQGGDDRMNHILSFSLNF